METIKPRNILCKKPFGYLLPVGTGVSRISDGSAHPVESHSRLFQEIDQIEFLRELDPRSHRIFDPLWYEDEKKQDPESGKWYVFPVERCSMPWQYIIKTKHLVHLCGNNIRFSDSNRNPDETDKSLLVNFRQGWLKKNMEVAWFDAANSVKCTGDAAFCGYLNRGAFGYRVFSFLDGDILYPHEDPLTGELDLFGREYSGYDSDGEQTERILEVWDEAKMYRFRRNTSGIKGKVNRLLDWLGLDDAWECVYEKSHGFPFLPISYHRNRIGACWTLVQPAIEQYEKDLSRYLQVNKMNVNPVIVITGDNVEVKGDRNKPITSIVTGPGGDAKRIPGGEASQSYERQLAIERGNILLGGFIVLPPEERSGDESGISIKIKYSPAIEQAMSDAREYNGFVDGMVRIFKYGYSLEAGKVSEYATMDISGEIVPYVHQNEAEIMQNLMTGVTGGYLSKESAAEFSPYSKNDELRRLKKEMKEALGADSITDVIYESGKGKEEEVETETEE